MGELINGMSMGEAWQMLQDIARHGLFLTRLNNGDWMVGKGNYIYSMRVTDDHYANPHLSISPNIKEAVANATFL